MRPSFAPIINDRSAWRGSELAKDRSWITTFSQAELDELDAALQGVLAKNIPLLEITRDDFPLPRLAQYSRSTLPSCIPVAASSCCAAFRCASTATRMPRSS